MVDHISLHVPAGDRTKWKTPMVRLCLSQPMNLLTLFGEPDVTKLPKMEPTMALSASEDTFHCPV